MMKNHGILQGKTTAYILLISVCLTLFLSCGTDDVIPGDNTTAAEGAELNELYQLLGAYSVVVDDSGEVTDSGYLFCSDLSGLCGVKLSFSRESAANAGKNIYIGNTEALESSGINESILSQYDFVIHSQTDSVLIAGGNPDSLNKALEYFMSCMLDKQILGSVIKGEYSYAYHENFVELCSESESYNIVIPDDNEIRDIADTLAYNISELTSMRPAVINLADYDGKSPAVLLGTQRGEDLKPLDYRIGYDETTRNIIISAEKADSVKSAVVCLISVLKENNGKYPQSYAVLYQYDYAEGEYEASVINNESTAADITSAVKASIIFEPSGSSYYNHDTYLAVWNGSLYAGWSSGDIDENAPGQRVMFSYSSDGSHWSDAAPIVDRQMGKDSELVCNFRGFYAAGERLVAYFSTFEYRKEYLRSGNRRPEKDIGRGAYTMYYCYSSDGINWSEPTELGGVSVFRCMSDPLPQGRLILPGHNDFLYTDSADGISDLKSFTVSQSSAISRGAEVLWESSYYTADDKVIMMSRSNTGVLWCSISRDNGASYSEAYPTMFTDDNAKVEFGNLPDGRAYYVGCPEPEGNRSPLVLAISENGYDFNESYIIGNDISNNYRQQKTGIYKTGVYSYPSATVFNGKIFIICSIYKEAVTVFTASIK